MFVVPEQIDISYDETNDTLILLESVFYNINGIKILVPSGFQYDGASIPWWARPLIGSKFHPDFQKAAAPHDYIYRKSMGKLMGDYLFNEILLLYNKKWKATVMFLAVYLFGWKVYNNYRKMNNA